MKKKMMGVCILFVLMVSSITAEAGLWFHATKKAVAQKIMRRGFSVSRANPGARFGRGVYFSKSPATALKERPGSGSVIASRFSKGVNRSALNTKGISPAGLKKYSGLKDMRGTIHRKTIGPKLGHKIGQKAGRQGRAVIFKSAKSRKGTNIFVPARTNNKHPRSIKPIKVANYGR